SADFDGNEVDDVLMRYKDGSWLIYSFDGMEVSTQGFLPMTNDLNWRIVNINHIYPEFQNILIGTFLHLNV
ncbi:MAG: hypothetical protein ACJA0W_003769, partial [Candidatus Azotimanducaceae bacterium]